MATAAKQHSLPEWRKKPGRIPFGRFAGAETVVDKPLHRFVQMLANAAQIVALVGVHLMAEIDAVLDQCATEHQRMLLVHGRVGGAVDEEVLPIGQVGGTRRQVGGLQLQLPLGDRVASGGHEAIGEERAFDGWLW